MVKIVIERIDSELCTGCGLCVNACWMDVIRMDNKGEKAVIKYPEDCASCNSCAVDCPVRAIYVSPTEGRALPFTCIGL